MVDGHFMIRPHFLHSLISVLIIHDIHNYLCKCVSLTVLVEANVSSSLSEALTADVQSVLSDQTGVRRAHTALSRTFTKVSWV